MAKWHRNTLSCFYPAKGSRVKNTTIKTIFIVEKLQFLASGKSHFLFFSQGGLLSLTQVLVLKMNCLKRCQYLDKDFVDLQSIPLRPTCLHLMYCRVLVSCTCQILTSVDMGDLKKAMKVSVYSHGHNLIFITDTTLKVLAKIKPGWCCWCH